MKTDTTFASALASGACPPERAAELHLDLAMQSAPPSGRPFGLTITVLRRHARLYPFASVPATSPLGLRPRLGGVDDAVEAAADCTQKRFVAERAADQFAPLQRGERRVVSVPCREDRRSAARGR
jgi:hypothetical protein